MENMQSVFKTSDIVLAAWLLSVKDAALVGLDDSDPKRCKFLIRPRPTPQDLLEFSEGNALAPVHSFYTALRTLKTELYRAAQYGGVR